MDEKRAAVVNRLLEDDDVQIIDPPPPAPPPLANAVHHPGEFRNSRRFAAGSLNPSNRPDIKSSPPLLVSVDLRNSRRFAAQPSRAYKNLEIRNSGAEFLISLVFGRTKKTGNKTFRG